jgi:fibronectin type 3 domain-containing protein
MKDVHGARNLDEPRFLPSGIRRRRLRPWLRALAGTCLAVAMVGASAMMAGGAATGAHALSFARAPSRQCLPPFPTASTEFDLKAAASGTDVQLTWDPAASGPPHVWVKQTVQGGCVTFEVPSICAITNQSAMVVGLPTGTTYYFWLFDNNDGKSTVVSNMAQATISGTTPGAPAGLAASPGNGQVTLSWAARPSGCAPSAIRYNVYQGTSSGGETGPVSCSPVTATSCTVTGLTNGTTYYFKVTAVYQLEDPPREAEGPPGAEVNAVPATLPGAPTGLTAAAGNGQVTLSWAAPASDGGSPVTAYRVYQGAGPGGETGPPVTCSPVTPTRCTVTGLVNGTTYYFKVTAVNKVGEGPGAEVRAVPATVPGAPTGLAAVPGNGQVTLSWAAPASDGGSPVTGYNLYAGTTPDFTGKPPLGKVTGTAVTVTGLVNGTIYYFMVTAVNGVGEGPGAEVRAVPLTVPTAPTGLTAVPGNGQVALSWAAPASDGGSPVTGYIIYQGTSPGGETGTPVKGSPVTATSHTVTGLTNGTTYYFKVVAVNAAGLSPLSEEASAKLLIVPSSTPPSSTPPSSTPPSTAPASTAPPSTAPASTAPAFAPPTGLAAAAGDTKVRLSWTAPVSDGGSSVIRYNVYVTAAPGVQGATVQGSTTSNDVTVTNLTNGTVYYFMVTAVNASGNQSPFSTEVSAEPVAATELRVAAPSPTAPAPLIALLSALAAMAAAAGFTLIARSRRVRSPSRQETAVTPDVRAVPDTSRPDALGVRDTGQEPTHTVRLEPQPGVATTTMKEGRP